MTLGMSGLALAQQAPDEFMQKLVPYDNLSILVDDRSDEYKSFVTERKRVVIEFEDIERAFLKQTPVPNYNREFIRKLEHAMYRVSKSQAKQEESKW